MKQPSNYDKLVSISLYLFTLILIPSPLIAYFAFRKENKFIALHALFITLLVIVELTALFATFIYIASTPITSLEDMGSNNWMLVIILLAYLALSAYGILASLFGKTPVLMKRLDEKISKKLSETKN